jgi:hypothetical protein
MQKLKIGDLYAFTYVMLLAMSVIWVHSLHTVIHESLMLLIVSASAILIYNIISIKSLKCTYKSILRTPVHWAAMSLVFALTWGLMYFSTIQASPRASIVLFYLVVALLGCISNRQLFYSLCCAAAILISINILPELTTKTIFSGILSGIAGYFYMKLSETYARSNKLEASQVLAVRFYFMFFMSLLYITLSKHALVHINFNGSVFWLIGSLILLIIFNLVPNYCAQKSLVLVGTNKFSQIISLTPAVTFILQGIYEKQWNTYVLILCVVISLLLNFISQRKHIT